MTDNQEANESSMGERYLQAIAKYNRRHALPNKAKSVLLVIDVQKSFSYCLSPQVISNINKLVRLYLDSKPEHAVIFTQHGHENLEDEDGGDGGMLLKWWGKCIKRGSESWELVPDLGVQSILEEAERKSKQMNTTASTSSSQGTSSGHEEKQRDDIVRVLQKKRYSAFIGTELDELLKSWQVEEVVICGVLTECCCETTARDAFCRDYRVFFVCDATATRDEVLHLSTLRNLAHAFAHVVSTEQLLAAST
jgi:isochorismate hydrolase